MPRRPRPASRKQRVQPPIQPAHENSDSENESESVAASEEQEEEDEDVDAPRVVQWVDDDNDSEESDEEEESARAGPSTLNSLQEDLSVLPLGSLLKAQRALKRATASDSSSEEDGESDESEPEIRLSSKGKEPAKPEWSAKPRNDIPKRSNKHAPTEVTSKRPVTRRRTVVESTKIQSRDPRFLSFAGQLAPDKFHQHYGFLSDSHKSELKTLRENLKLARKRVASSPRDLRVEREDELDRLERAVKRMESLVNQDRKTKVDREALTKVHEAEKAKQKEGKKAWFMKTAEKNELLVRARYEALAADGGSQAVKKAMMKKQKKVGQKEKKSRPFVDKRSGVRPRKRQRIE